MKLQKIKRYYIYCSIFFIFTIIIALFIFKHKKNNWDNQIIDDNSNNISVSESEIQCFNVSCFETPISIEEKSNYFRFSSIDYGHFVKQYF